MRKELKNYLETNGIMQKHIARVMGVSDSMISAFLLGKEDFGEAKRLKLERFLNGKI